MISYNKLWKLLIDKKMTRADLRKSTGISPNTLTKLNKDEEVSLSVLTKICAAMDVDIGDIVEYVNNQGREEMTNDSSRR